jgi:divalent metal cation (Fe/Co/Zn/Cd) transporter
MKGAGWKLWLVTVLAVFGTVAKASGWLVYGSITLMVDTLTCIANLVALGGALYFSRFSSKAPDERHPYGHLRLSLAGSYIVILTYSFIAGLSTMELIHVHVHSAPREGALYSALAGLLFYSPLPFLLKDREDPLQIYGLFSISEILESLVAISMIGLSIGASPIYDYIGGIIILGFIFYEIIENSAKYIKLTADTSPHPEILNRITGEIESALGVRVSSIKVREIYPGRFQGDIVVKVPPNYTIVEAHNIADQVEGIGRKYNTLLTVHVEPGGEECFE